MSERPPHTESELIELIRSIDVPAPEELHRRVQALVAERPARGRRRLFAASAPSRTWRLAGASAILAAVAVALVLGLAGNGSPQLSVRQTMALTLRPATMAAPGRNPRARTQLTAAVDGIAFPYWDDRFGWRSAGARTDRLDGRTVTTVFYANSRGQRIGYAIVAGTPAPNASGGVVSWRRGTPYRLLTQDGMHLVTWRRDGRLCVVTGRGVDSATLLALASWDAGGAVAV